MFLKVIACEIAVREFYFAAAHSPNLVDLEFLTQGHHDTPARGRTEIQTRINSVSQGKYDAIVLGYGLCSNILTGLSTPHTPLVIPRAHDCITFFLGSKERYQQRFTDSPGTYYYTSGWLECAKRRGQQNSPWGGASLPSTASLTLKAPYEEWVTKYGEDQAKYLLEEMSRWTNAYSNGTLIEFDFLNHLGLEKQVQQICTEKGWQYDRIPGDLGLIQKLLDGPWPNGEFLTVTAGSKVIATYDEHVIGTARNEPT